MLVRRVQSGLMKSSLSILLSSQLICMNDEHNKSCTWVLNCYSFCGLGFESVWATIVASCKHLYHPWCTLIHFNFSTKCVNPSCEQMFHDNWRLCNGINKLGLENDFGRLLNGEIATPNHYPPFGCRTKALSWPSITSLKKLPSLFYFTITTQVVNKRPYKWNWGR
jgi:hypothetical protein